MAVYRWKRVTHRERIVDDGTGDELTRAWRRHYKSGYVEVEAKKERFADVWHFAAVKFIREEV